MDGKKITFGFTKTLQKPKPLLIQPEKRELIECLDANEIKPVNKQEEKKALSIPVQANNSSFKHKLSQLYVKKEEPEVKLDPEQLPENETLEQRAIREILASAKSHEERKERLDLAVPLHPDRLPLDGAKESSMNDYEEVPIEDFGKAMLRGMGWNEAEAKKKEKEEEMDDIVFRPKGLGLGADKVITKRELLVTPAKNEDLRLKVNANVFILAGKQQNLYGQVIALDEHIGRVVIRLALGGKVVSLTEAMVQVVSKEEYTKYSKVINSVKYDQYKRKETSGETSSSSSAKEASSTTDRRRSPSPKKRRSPSPTASAASRHRSRRDRSSSRSRSSSSPRRSRDSHRSHKSKSYKNKKKSHKYKGRHQRSESRDRYSSDVDDKKHKKKTKRSKKPRSRSRECK